MRFTDEQIHEFCGYMRECKKCPQRVETSYGPGIPGCVCEVEEMLDAAVRIVSAASQPGAALAKFARDLAAAQTPLDPTAAKVLRENLHDLYMDGGTASNSSTLINKTGPE